MMERERKPLESAWKVRLKQERDNQFFRVMPIDVKRYVLTNLALKNAPLSVEGKKKVTIWRDQSRDVIVKDPELRNCLASYIDYRKAQMKGGEKK